MAINTARRKPALSYQHYLSSHTQSLLETQHVYPGSVPRGTMGTITGFGKTPVSNSVLNLSKPCLYQSLTIPVYSSSVNKINRATTIAPMPEQFSALVNNLWHDF